MDEEQQETSPDAIARGRLHNNLTNHPPRGDETVAKFESIRNAAKVLGEEIILQCPHSPERSIALSELEHCVMRAVQSIAVHQDA